MILNHSIIECIKGSRLHPMDGSKASGRCSFAVSVSNEMCETFNIMRSEFLRCLEVFFAYKKSDLSLRRLPPEHALQGTGGYTGEILGKGGKEGISKVTPER